MSKRGRARRTAQQRLAARETRATIGYIRRIEREVRREQEQQEASSESDK